ncbi:MAG: MotA/TolQ/ExbB proton channel family protein [Opitutales bacterium]|nr:MotA/TolQ/ExbB proton channel family protein [Opitutales bacterium]
MKRLTLILFCISFGVFSYASAAPQNAGLREKSLEKYEASLAKIAGERARMNAKIEAEGARAAGMERKLKALRENRTDFDFVLKTAALKSSQFDALRGNCAKLSSELGIAGLSPSDFDGFLSSFERLLAAADGEIFSAKILKSALPETDGGLFLKTLESGGKIGAKFDPSLGAISKIKTRTLWQKIEAGGVWIYPILFFGALALAMSAYKICGSLAMGRFKAQTLRDINSALQNGDVESAKKIAAAAPKPYNALLGKFLQNYGLSKSLTEEIAYEQMLSCGEKLFSGLGAISITASISPLLGLLGTVTGIIKTFGDLSAYGAGNPQLMSGGISEALITTEFGLMVAIPAFVLHAVLSRRAKAILSDMEKISSEYISKNCG